MRVALLIEKFTPAGGAERACAGLARGLVARGHEVHVFATRFGPLDGVTPRVVPPDGPMRHQSFAGRVRTMLENEAFDVVHSFCRTSRQDILRLGGGIHREYLARTDVAYSALGRWWRRLRPKERWELTLEAESLAAGASRIVVAVSHRVKEEAIRHYGVPAEKIEVVHNGVDASEFRPDPAARAEVRRELSLSDSDYLVLFCGSGFRRKGLRYAVGAVDRVPQARLAVVGQGTVPSHPRVLALGRRPDAARLYAAADVLVLPTLYDPFPNVCLEAMAASIPVVVSRVAGPSEVIDGDSIVVEDPTDVAELAAALSRLADPAVRLPMGEAARRKALLHPLERVVDANLALYERVVDAKRRAH